MTTGNPHARATILLVDDHEETRLLMEWALTRRGYVVQTAGTVADARETFEATKFDLVIADISLPDGTGFDLLRQLLTHGPVTAIAVSGYGLPADIAESRRAGFGQHLVKPVEVGSLERAVEQALRQA